MVCTLVLCAAFSSAKARTEEADTTRITTMETLEIVSSVKENGSLRQQPASVTLIEKKQMEDAQVTSLKDAAPLVPNLFIPDYGSRLTSAIYIRGIGSRINTPAVGLYVDNIPYADKSAFDFNFYDIEGIDILRGPQGTLYGRNTMGGLVRLRTKNPFSYQGTTVHLGYATGDQHRTLSATHYNRIGQRMAFSVGGYYEGKSGFFKNDVTGRRVDGMQAGGGRLRTVWLPGEDWKLDASVSYDYSDEGAYPYYLVKGASDQEPVGTIGNNRESRYRRGLLNVGANLQYQADKWQMNAITGYQHLTDRMFMDQDFIQADIYTLEQRQRIHTINEEITFKNKAQGAWEWVSGLNLMYQWLHTEAPVTFYEDGTDWLAGLVNGSMPDVSTIPALNRMGFTSMKVNFRNAPIDLGGQFETPTLGAALFHQSTLHLGSHLSATLGLRLDYEHNSMDYLAPSTVDYGFTLANPRTSMMQVDLQQLSSNLLYEGRLSNHYLNVLPKFSLKYEFDPANQVYFSLGKGTRSGGYNIQMFSELLQGSLRGDMMKGIQTGVADYLQKFTSMGMPASVIGSVTSAMAENMPKFEEPEVESVVYKPEQSWNYEVGTHLCLADKRLFADASLFYLHTRNQQIARFAESGMGRRMINAGKSQSYGAEVALRYLPTRNLTLTVNYGYTHATFTEWNTNAEGANMNTETTGMSAENATDMRSGKEGLDYSGNYVPFVPRHTINLDAAYTWFIHPGTGKGLQRISLGANFAGNGSLYWTEDNQHSQPFYGLLNARLSLESRHATLTIWGRNLTNKSYNTFFFESAGRLFEQHGKPLQLGLDVSLKF